MKLLGLLVTAWAGTMQDLQAALNVEYWDQGDPCSWRGVYCSLDLEVVAISVVHQSVRGAIPEGIFSELSQLRVLALSFAELQELELELPLDLCGGGSLTQVELNHLDLKVFPKQLLECVALEFLSVTNCGIRDELPEFSQWPNLKVVDFSQNLFSGGLPVSLTELVSLVTVNLYDNELSGVLLGFQSSSLQVLDVRKNQFEGTIPVSAI